MPRRALDNGGTTEGHAAHTYTGCAPTPARPLLDELLLSLRRRVDSTTQQQEPRVWCVAVRVFVCGVWWAVFSLPSRTLHGSLSGVCPVLSGRDWSPAFFRLQGTQVLEPPTTRLHARSHVS